jgi:hypothetical protein
MSTADNADNTPGNLVAALLERAATGMREKATAATPGPWERPLDTRHKNLVGAALPEDEEPRQWQGGIIPESFAQYSGYSNRYAGQRERVEVVQCSTWSDGRHDRKRNGRDLEYIAAMHPGVGLAVAEWLEESSRQARDAMIWQPWISRVPCWFCRRCERELYLKADGCRCWDASLAVAREWLGETGHPGGTVGMTGIEGTG